LVSFNYFDGQTPNQLIVDAQGNVFGLTTGGGLYGNGTAFELIKIGAGFTLKSLVSFDGGDGALPEGSLIADANGNLFGATLRGGLGGFGTVFEIAKTVSGYAETPRTVVSFNGTDGGMPTGGLIADANGDLFGDGSGIQFRATAFEILDSGFTARRP
jgi:uncharacterized repeat protein (TIGR03803 family)